MQNTHGVVLQNKDKITHAVAQMCPAKKVLRVLKCFEKRFGKHLHHFLFLIKLTTAGLSVKQKITEIFIFAFLHYFAITEPSTLLIFFIRMM